MKRINFLWLVFFLVNCSIIPGEFPAELHVTNKSSRCVGLYLGLDSSLPISDYSVKKGISVGEECTLYGSEEYMVNLLKDTGCNSLTIIVFDMDTLNSYTWNEIVAGHKVWQEIELSVKTMQNCGTFINIWD